LGSSKSDLVADPMTRGDPAARPNAQGQPNAQAPNAQEKMSEFRLTYYTRVAELDEAIKTMYYNYRPRRPRCPAISTQRLRPTEPANTKGKSAPRGDPAAAHEEPKRPLHVHTELNLDLPQCYTPLSAITSPSPRGDPALRSEQEMKRQTPERPPL